MAGIQKGNNDFKWYLGYFNMTPQQINDGLFSGIANIDTCEKLMSDKAFFAWADILKLNQGQSLDSAADSLGQPFLVRLSDCFTQTPNWWVQDVLNEIAKVSPIAINHQDAAGFTPLHFAALSCNRHFYNDVLIKNGALELPAKNGLLPSEILRRCH